MAVGVSGTIWGSFSGVSTANVRPYIAYSETYEASTNTSSVTAVLWFVKYNASWGSYNASMSNTGTINGDASTANSAFDLRPVGTANVYDEVRSRTVSVAHSADGSKSITIAWSGDTSTSLGTFNFSDTVALTTITRTSAVTTSAASSVAGTSATANGTVSDAGLPPCTDRGVYWGTTSGSQPNKISSGSGSGAFTANITGLSRGTTYYFKAFSYNTSYGYVYGSVLNFTTTAAAPSVTTGASSSIGATTATVAGTVTNNNGAAVTARGICYNTTGSPTTASSTVAAGTGDGAFSSDLTGLAADTTHYAKAYATNSVGTSYGAEVSFDTLTAEPTVTTTAGATGITISAATVAGNVTSDNGSAILERGFVYGLAENPTTADSKATVTGTTGAMSKELTGMATATLHHFRAFGTNAEGTGYGTDSTFTTLPGDPSGLSATANGKTQVDLTWTKGTGGTYTIVRRGTEAPANINSGTLVYQGTASSYSNTGLTAGTLYYYRAWAATTADWSVAYSASYSADSVTTVYSFTNPNNALTDDANYATIKTNDGKLYTQVSKDDGATWTTTKELTFTADITTQSFGLGTTELWGTSWVGSDLDNGSFAIRLIGGSSTVSSQIYKTFGFTITDAAILTGVQVQVKGAFDATDLLLYFVKANGYYGTSPLPVGEGSLAYDSTLDRPTYYEGTEWIPVGGGSKVTVSDTAPSSPKTGDIWVDIGV